MPYNDVLDRNLNSAMGSGGVSGGVTAGVSGAAVGGLNIASSGSTMGAEASTEVVVTDANVTGNKLTIHKPRG